MGKPVPTLDSAGWVRDVPGKADRLIAYYFETEYSQSNLYYSHLTSLPSQIQKYSSNDEQLVKNVETELQRYLAPYFDTVEVNATTARPNREDPNRTNLTVSIFVTEDDVRYSLGHEIQVVDSKIQQIVRLNNLGQR